MLLRLSPGWQRFPTSNVASIDANSSILAKAREIAGKVRLPTLAPVYA